MATAARANYLGAWLTLQAIGIGASAISIGINLFDPERGIDGSLISGVAGVVFACVVVVGVLRGRRWAVAVHVGVVVAAALAIVVIGWPLGLLLVVPASFYLVFCWVAFRQNWSRFRRGG